LKSHADRIKTFHLLLMSQKICLISTWRR